MKKSIILLVFILIILGTGIGVGTYIYINVLNIDTIYEGVKIDNYDVGGKTKEEAIKSIKAIRDPEVSEGFMNLVYGEKVYKVGLRDLGFKYKYDLAVKSAYDQGREGKILDKLKKIKNMKTNPKNISLESEYEKEKIKLIVGNISQEINKEPLDAEFDFNSGNIRISDEVMGIKLDEEDLIKKIDENIYILGDIDIVIKDIKPKVTKELLSRINGVIGEYSTSFKGSTADRAKNIKLSAKAFKGKMLLPGEELSYNNTTGPRESKFGYKEANVIIGGELTPGVGGGVCQTSTTMYNALLLSNLTILERHPHSLPPSYVNYGQDAAVAYGYLDLKFRNDFDYPIYIDTKVVDRVVYIYIYGDLKSKDYTVKIKPEIVETIGPKTEEIYDANLPPGSKLDIQKGRTGYKVKTYKSIIKNGKEVETNQITSDYYKQKDHIYKIGPKQMKESESIPTKTDEKIESEEEDINNSENFEVEDEN